MSIESGVRRDFGRRDGAVKGLVSYFAERTDGFTGRWFDQWIENSDPNVFTPADLYAVRALSVPMPVRAGAELLGSSEITQQLALLPVDKDLWTISDETLSKAIALNYMIQEINGLGKTTTSKLMAAKRPRLIPIYDSVVEKRLKPTPKKFWREMQQALKNEDLRCLVQSIHLEAVQTSGSDVPEDLSVLRVIDVVVWMAGRK